MNDPHFILGLINFVSGHQMYTYTRGG